ncbi:RNA ligase (ATP) [Patescibacteria group bacterium]|nr:RNA ligase (ATP) [Patescibacteria group bacterium]
MTSTHKVEVVAVTLQDHPNADTLSVVKVFGYSVCVRTEDWQGVDKGAYIPPDSIVPDLPEYEFLGKHKRIRVKRLRGVISMGMLMPAPEGSELGDDVAEKMQVTHYEPSMTFRSGGDSETPPRIYSPKYDVETFYRYPELIKPGEMVVATEKIHGANARFVWFEDRMWCGSKTTWRKQDESSAWWKALKFNTSLENFCKENPGIVVYGEVYGPVQKLKYGTASQIKVAVFDLLRKDEWIPYLEAKKLAPGLDWVPEIYVGPFDEEKMRALADGQSLIKTADHVREGIVVKPLEERQDLQIGRVQLKLVSNAYLEKAS